MGRRACLESRRQNRGKGLWHWWWDDGDDGDGSTRITFKVSHIAFEMLRDQPGLRPAPYLASRGFKWIQHFEAPGLSDEELKEYLMESHHLVSLGLTKKLQKQLGLNQD